MRWKPRHGCLLVPHDHVGPWKCGWWRPDAIVRKEFSVKPGYFVHATEAGRLFQGPTMLGPWEALNPRSVSREPYIHGYPASPHPIYHDEIE